MAKKEQIGNAPLSEIPKVPFPIGDRGAYVPKAIVAAEIVQVPTVGAIAYSIAYDRVEVVYISVSEISLDPQGQKQFHVDGNHVMGGPGRLAQTHLAWLRDRALKSGATPDAIRLLAKITEPFTKKEEAIMAEKLKSKAAPKKANADELKAAAKKTPVGGKKNVGDNLAKARAARAERGPDMRKIKPLIKAKDIAAREGTYRHEMITDLLDSKTVQEFRDKDERYSAGDLRYAVDANIVMIS
jgi:hypothetical protein